VIAAECGDAAACRRLVEAFLPAIANVARGFAGSRVERRELLQEGVAGLLFAARRYDAALDTPFWAYASFWVRKAMQELVAELTGPVVLSDRALRGLAAIRKARNDHLQHDGVEPTTEQLVRATGFTREQVETLRSVGGSPLSLHYYGDRITDGVAERAYDRVLDDIEVREVRDLADRLDERERAVIRAHYGLAGPAQTLNQIGGTLGLTAERARQIEAGALTKLRSALARPVRGGA
jgi:RNA polymerase primary sigma factor